MHTLNTKWIGSLQKNSNQKRLVKHWKRLPRGIAVSPMLEVFKRYVDTQGHGLVTGLAVLG